MTDNRLDKLAAAWSTDDPDPALRAELEERLRRDPAARRHFLDHCVAEMALVESLASAAQAKQVTQNKQVAGNKEAIDDRAPLRQRPHRGSRRFTALPIALWAAGLAALLFIAILLIPKSDAVRVTAGNLVADGRTISTGGRVVLPLTSAMVGSDGVELNDPAGIVLRATPDSTFAISTPGTIRLDSGKITLDVDGKRAPPTTVHTDEMVVSVVGTRFTVARSTAKTDIDVQQGQVRVTTPDNTVRELSTGMRIAANAAGFILDKPPIVDQPQPRPLRLIVIAEDLSQRIVERLDQPIRIPANRPFTVRAEVGTDVVALGYRLASNQDLPMRPKRVEFDRPFDLWGDVDNKPTLSSLPPGTHHMTLKYFADKLGEQALETRQFILKVE